MKCECFNIAQYFFLFWECMVAGIVWCRNDVLKYSARNPCVTEHLVHAGITFDDIHADIKKEQKL